jgi:hypothetical protein
MQVSSRTLGPALISGALVSLATTGALMLLARGAGKRAVQPTNATSHWLHGERAGKVARADVAHTAVGYATHHASAVFWALILEAWLSDRSPRPLGRLLANASAMTAIAAAVDYGITPRRLTPGWESVLSKRSIGAVFVVMAVAMTVGAAVNGHLQRSSASAGE